MSSTAGWHSEYKTSDSSLNTTGWGVPSHSTYSSPISHPDSWPQLGEAEQEGLEMHQQPNQSFGNMQQQDSGGWGNPDVNNSGASNGWGTLPTPSQQSSGWGNTDNAGNWSRPQVDNGTAVWGKQNQTTGGSWGAPSNPPTTGWNMPVPPSTQAPDVPKIQSSNTQQEQQQSPQTIQQQPTGNAPSQPPESWAAAAAAQPGQSQPAVSEQQSLNEAEVDQQAPSQAPQLQTQEQSVAEMEDNVPDVDDPIQKLVNSHDGWGKRPIQQNTSWDITDAPSYNRQPSIKTGTEAWSKIPPGQAAGGGGGGGWNEPTKQGWQGNVDPNTQGWSNKPASVNPARGWGATNQVSQQPRPPWSGSQSNPANQQPGWGADTRTIPPPMPNINTNRWSSPSGANPNSANQGWPQQAPPQQANTGGGWSNPAAENSGGWGTGMQRNPQATSNWGGGRPAGPDGGWNQQQQQQQQQNVPMQRLSSQVDDGTSAWGDPKAYDHVNMWDKKSGVGDGPVNQGKPEATGWGAPAGQVPGMMNKPPSPTGWGDGSANRQMMDSGASVWNKNNSTGSNWDQNPNWGQGKPNNSTGWGQPEQPVQPWGQNDVGQGWNQQQLKNDPSASRGNMDFGFIDRKTSTGSDSVFEEGQGDGNGQNLSMGMPGNGRPGMNFNQYQGGQPNNMPGMNGPRPVPPQPLMNQPNLQSPMIRGQVPPMPPQLQNQLQQIRHAVMKGVIPQRMLNPQLMTPQHLNLLQQLVMKTTEYQQLMSRMNLLNKPNLPPQLRSQQEQTARMLQQCQQQIQAHQRALTQNMIQKTNQLQGKANMGGLGPNGNLSLDLTPASSAMPPGNSNTFNMSKLAQNMPGPGASTTANREQQSRLNTWKRPSIGMDSPSDNGGDPQLNPLMSHASISDMIGDQGLLLPSSVGQGLDLPNQSRVTGGGLLGLQQPDGNGTIGQLGDPAGEPNGLSNREFDLNVPNSYPNAEGQSLNEPGIEQATMAGNQEAAAPNLKNILADIGPPEFIPGVKWAGFRPIDPENDPDITPGSVAIAKTMSVNTVKDVDQVLNRDRYTNSQLGSPASIVEAKPDMQSQSLASSFANNTLTDNPAISSTWSTATGSGGSSLSHTPTSLSHELWKVPLPKQSSLINNRPPPGGFPSQNSGWSAGPASSWSSNMPPNSTNRYSGTGGQQDNSGWTENKTWVVLTGLNPQMDFNSLRNLCSMKGNINIISFQPNYPIQGMVLIRYSSGQDAMYAQKALNMYVMGDIMLVANIASDQEVSNFMTASSGNTWSTGSGQSRFSSRNSFGSSGTLLSNHHQQPPLSQYGMHGSASAGDMQRLWSTGGGNNGGGFGAPPSATSWSTGGNPIPNRGGSNLWGSTEDPTRMTSPLHSLLPENLLSEQTM